MAETKTPINVSLIWIPEQRVVKRGNIDGIETEEAFCALASDVTEWAQWLKSSAHRMLGDGKFHDTCIMESRPMLAPPKKVIFNGPATICIWPDGSKTVVKCSENDRYSERAGLTACMLKHAYGNAYLKSLGEWASDPDDSNVPRLIDLLRKFSRGGSDE